MKGSLYLSLVAAGLLLVSAAGPAAKADSQDGAAVWTQLGPMGGNIVALARHTKAPSKIYALTGGSPGQFFRSADNGTSWKRMAIFENTTYDIAVDPNNGDIVYVLAYSALYKSTNTGASFAEIRFPDGICGNGRMAVRPNNPNILYVAGTFRADNKGCLAFLKSANGGQTWTANKFDTGATYSTAVGIAVSPKNPNIIYFCGYFQHANGRSYNRIYRSRNGGNSWDNITGPILNQNDKTPSGLAVDPKNADRVFVAYNEGVLRSANGGTTWLGQNSSSFYAGPVAVDPNQADTLYAPSGSLNDFGVYKSTDGGTNWKKYPKGVYGSANAVIIKGNTIQVGTSAGIFGSKNGGGSYQASHRGIKATWISTFALSASPPGTIYAEACGYTHFKSSDGGASWTKGTDFYRCHSIMNFAVHPRNPNTVLILAGG